jgi:2-polyprenyl-3-methyl-5-hydroxy-6-metoxy-1,4-benzoquinol methylase
MSLLRQVESEWLGELAADDPRAIRARRGLTRVNAWMLQPRIMAATLTKYCRPEPPRTLLDVGAGDGMFSLRLARRLTSRWRNVTITLLDRQNIVSIETREAFRALGWKVETVAADVFDFFENEDASSADVTIANLLLHEFPPELLTKLLAQVAHRTQLFVACEPRRDAFTLLASRLLWAIGCNEIVRHDAVVSVRAGFAGKELSALWPKGSQWELHEHAAGLFTHCFVARRTGVRETK